MYQHLEPPLRAEDVRIPVWIDGSWTEWEVSCTIRQVLDHVE